MTYTYDDLINDNVQFLQGTQADLNLYLPNAPSTIPTSGAYEYHPKRGQTNTYKGAAKEGAFYLTTDTHRIYIGRKVLSGTDANKIFPEEVSTGIATVVDSGDLASAQTTGAAHDGDFYYIKSSNVLAVFESNGSGGGQWIQINSPTNISGVNQVFTDDYTLNNEYVYVPLAATATNGVRLRTSVATSGGSANNDIFIKPGDNITIKQSTTNDAIEISAANSQSNLGIETSTAAANKAPVVLSDGINLDTKVHFVGKNDTTVAAAHNYVASTDTSVNPRKTYYIRTGTTGNYVYTATSATNGNPSTLQYYERENIVTVAGPGINGTQITSLGLAGATTGTSGFKFAIEVEDGDTSGVRYAMLSDTYSYLDPAISYGHTSAVYAKFRGGIAELDVYTTSETDAKISSEIVDHLKGVNALHYKGTVATVSELTAKDDGTAQIGDVWKASADFTYNGESIKAGDLFIAQGTETNGVIPANGVTWAIVPSGDEPLLAGKVIPSTNGNPSFGLEDEHIAGNWGDAGVVNTSKRPLYVTFDNANSTLVKAFATGTSDNFLVTLHHQAAVTGTSMAINAPAATATMWTNSGTIPVDSIGDKALSFSAIKTIEKDAFGHITKIIGQNISIQHNYLKTIKTVHSSTTSTQGMIRIGAEDYLGLCDSTITQGTISLSSDTLKISATAGNTGLNLNLVWGSF